ncbi:hypothetical protein NP233_g2329 [Leucocoprinus birnbaumii]|uniref:Endopeptidase S2P n=1 Tax=Leucocoprinus birnbaumii TaxID=56174 RepID=A0AAD5VYH1_9AGAR|nr:hypothetical protein NP233_g2329 [Leucocoprinus birnbaumii]
MPLSSFLYSLSLFWLIIHIIHRLSTHHKQGPILPSSISVANRSQIQWNITVQFLHARIETTRWNNAHDRLLSRLKRRRGERVWLERMYDMGLGVGVVGMVVALVLLVWTTWSLMKSLAIRSVEGGAGSVGRLLRRDMDGTVRRSYEDRGMDSPITPIIPGLTVPIAHIPFILVSLFLSQIVHEMGHAISGALYGIPILSSGASLIICIPAAFVAFSTEKLDTLRPAMKAKITAAGPFHNLLFLGVWFLVGWVMRLRDGMVGGLVLSVAGYRDVSEFGRVVVGVEETSPLAGYLIPGTIVTKLNDHSMVPSEEDSDPWSSFLKSSKNDEMEFGWCVDSAELGVCINVLTYAKANEDRLESSSKECCLPDEPTLTSLSCFVANTKPIQLGCLNPVPILTSTDPKVRCYSETGCHDGSVCVRPAEKENLLRLTVLHNDQDREEVVLWTGPRNEIYDEVTVDKWLPRFSFLPLSLPSWLNIFWEYMSTVNHSLFLFNLVPISGLDGSHLLRSLFEMVKDRGSETYDLEALESGDATENHRSRPRFEALERLISGGAAVLVGLDLVLVGLGLLRT